MRPDRVIRHQEPTTQANWRSVWRCHLQPNFGCMPIGLITRSRILEYREDLQKRYAASTCNYIISQLQGILSYAVQKDKLLGLLLLNLFLLGQLDPKQHDLSCLVEYVEKISEATGVPIHPSYPLSGRDAFRTATGVHAAAIIKATKTGDHDLADRVYSSVPARVFGRKQEIEIGHYSGRSNVIYWLREHGYEPSDELVDKVFAFAKRITRLSRPGTPEAADFIDKWLTWGAGPRASMNLILAAKAHALLRGSNHVAGDDVVAVATPILRHRLILNFAAQSEGVTIDEVIRQLVKAAAKAVAA